MTQRKERLFTIACVADQSSAAAALHESLGVVFPMASILRVDTDAERVLPDAVDCAVIDATAAPEGVAAAVLAVVRRRLGPIPVP